MTANDKCLFPDIAESSDKNISIKEHDKINKYKNLEIEIKNGILKLVSYHL